MNEHALVGVVREAAARWSLNAEDTEALVGAIKPEAFAAYAATPERYTVDAVSRALASAVYFQIRLPRAVRAYLDATGQ